MKTLKITRIKTSEELRRIIYLLTYQFHLGLQRNVFGSTLRTALKMTVNVISNDSTYKDDNSRFTMVL